MNSLCWMPEDVREKYEQLRAEADAKGKREGKCEGQGKHCSVGKPGVKEASSAQLAHNLKQQVFSACCLEAFGSKELFWHLVKAGLETTDLTELVHAAQRVP